MIFSQICNMINMGIAVVDEDLKVHHWNRWLEIHTGIPEKTIHGISLLDHFPNLNQKWFLKNCKRVFTAGNFAFFSHKLHRYILPVKPVHHFSPGFKFMRQNCLMGPIYNDEKKIDLACLMIQDATEEAMYEASLQALSKKDSLTGLYNRVYLNSQLKRELARHKRYDSPFTIILADIDSMRVINSTCSYTAGDEILIKVADILRARLRAVDIVARYEGDGMCILLPETPLKPAMHVARELGERVEKAGIPFDESGKPVTISLGVIDAGAKELELDQLLGKIDSGFVKISQNGPGSVTQL